jgi:hypothetical protein
MDGWTGSLLPQVSVTVSDTMSTAAVTGEGYASPLLLIFLANFILSVT